MVGFRMNTAVTQLGMILVRSVKEVSQVAEKFESDVVVSMTEMNQIPFLLQAEDRSLAVFSIRIKSSKHEEGATLTEVEVLEVCNVLRSHFGMRFMQHGWT
jgi:hypothetical protein